MPANVHCQLTPIARLSREGVRTFREIRFFEKNKGKCRYIPLKKNLLSSFNSFQLLHIFRRRLTGYFFKVFVKGGF